MKQEDKTYINEYLKKNNISSNELMWMCYMGRLADLTESQLDLYILGDMELMQREYIRIALILGISDDEAENVKNAEDIKGVLFKNQEKLKEQSEKVRQQEGIVVSTLHSAKGLEFERVYILDVNEGCMPYQKAILDPEIEEERRMFYVGMTRAKKELHLYAVEERFGKKMEPSRFLVELEEAPKRGSGGQKNGK